MNPPKVIIEHLKTLGIEETDRVPLMKEVRKSFLKIVKQNHPDGGGCEEDFTNSMSN